MNTHEYYCSFETAKLLKEAGFDWRCTAYYENGELSRYSLNRDGLIVMNFNANPDYMCEVSAPTLAVAQRWLREVRRHDVFVSPCNGLYFYTVRKYYHEGKVDYFDYPNKDAFDTYEKTLETGIKKALEMILKKGE